MLYLKVFSSDVKLITNLETTHEQKLVSRHFKALSESKGEDGRGKAMYWCYTLILYAGRLGGTVG